MQPPSVQSAVNAWQSYVPDAVLFRHSGPPTQQTLYGNNGNAPPPAADPRRIHSLQDDHWRVAQQAGTRMVKRASVATAVPSPPGGSGQLPEPPPKAKVSATPQPQVAEIQPLEDTQRRDADFELFMTQMKSRPSRPSAETILELPPPVETLQYCAQFRTTTMPWFVGAQKTMAKHPDLAPPRLPLYHREYLQPFFREPDPRARHERPCFNLDREPVEGEHGRLRCIAHRLSEERLGRGQGYRLRELLDRSQSTEINIALARQGKPPKPGQAPLDPCDCLKPIPELCVMCHVWLTTMKALDQRNHLAEREAARAVQVEQGATGNFEVDDGGNEVQVFNAFMVDIDKVGEYDRHCLLAGDDVGMGIWGPFPLWNERNYAIWRDPSSGLRGFQELERMLFRQAPVPSQYQRSNRTSATAANTRSPA